MADSVQRFKAASRQFQYPVNTSSILLPSQSPQQTNTNMNLPKASLSKENSNWTNACLALGIVLVITVLWLLTPVVIATAIGLLIPEPPPRAYRNNQHELLRDGRCVDLIFKGHDAKDGSFLVQTSKHKGLLSVTLKSRPLSLAAEPDLRILPNGRAVLFIKSESGKEPSPIGLDEFLEGVAEVPDYK
jgi:hypothetical protein